MWENCPKCNEETIRTTSSNLIVNYKVHALSVFLNNDVALNSEHL